MCMLLDAGVPETYWQEARQYAVLFYNRIPPVRKAVYWTLAIAAGVTL